MTFDESEEKAYEALREIIIPALDNPLGNPILGFEGNVDYIVIGKMADLMVGDPLAFPSSVCVSVFKEDKEKSVKRLEAMLKQKGVKTTRQDPRETATYILSEHSKYVDIGVIERGTEGKEEPFIKVAIKYNRRTDSL